MCFRFLSTLLACLAMSAAHAEERVLRVCADPDNLPYSNARGEGFENRIAQLIAGELHARLQYEWAPTLRGFVRKTIGEGRCDVFIGVPAGFERVTTTRPYYRSSYVFVSRSATPIGSFDDPSDLKPVSQIGLADKLPYTDDLPNTPRRSPEAQAKMDKWFARVVSNQHPDHDT